MSNGLFANDNRFLFRPFFADWKENCVKNPNDSNQRRWRPVPMHGEMGASEWSVETIKTIDLKEPSRAANNRNVIYTICTLFTWATCASSNVHCTTRSQWHSIYEYGLWWIIVLWQKKSIHLIAMEIGCIVTFAIFIQRTNRSAAISSALCDSITSQFSWHAQREVILWQIFLKYSIVISVYRSRDEPKPSNRMSRF